MSSTSALNRAVTKKSTVLKPLDKTTVPKLLELCYKKLISHKHLLYKVGKAPYYLLKRVLRHCTPDELRNLEEANPHLMYEDMELWKEHFFRDQSNLLIRDNDPDEDWRQRYWRSKEEQAERLASALAKLRQSKKQHDRQKEEKKIKILPGLHDPSRKRKQTGWQKMTPLQKLRRDFKKNDYYRPVFKNNEPSTITSGNSPVVSKNSSRHQPYPTVSPVASQRNSNSVIQNNRSHSFVNSRIPNSAHHQRSNMDLGSRTGPIRSTSTTSSQSSRITNSSVQSRRTINTSSMAQTRTVNTSSMAQTRTVNTSHIAQTRNVNISPMAQMRNVNISTMTHSRKLANSRATLTASTRVVAKNSTTKLSDNSHVIRTKLDVRQQLYPKTRHEIQNSKSATIKSSKHLKPKY